MPNGRTPLLRLAFMLALILGATEALAAQMLTVSGTQVTDSGGNLLASGQIEFQPVDQLNRPISFHRGGGGFVLIGPVSATVTNGAFTIHLPDVSKTNPSNVCFRVSVFDSVDLDENVAGPGLTCLQPSTDPSQSTWCTSTACNLDNYVPATPGLMPVTAGPAGTVTFRNVTSLPAGSAPTVTNSGSAQNAVLDIGIPAGATGAPGTTTATGANGGFVVPQELSSGSTNGVPNASACGYTYVSLVTPPTWCVGSDIGAWINAAIGTFNGGPGTVTLDPSTSYTLSTTARIPNNINLEAQGTVLHPASANTVMIAKGTVTSDTSKQPTSQIRNLDLDSQFFTGGTGVYLGGDPTGTLSDPATIASFQIFDNVHIRGFQHEVGLGNHVYGFKFKGGKIGDGNPLYETYAFWQSPGAIDTGEQFELDGLSVSSETCVFDSSTAGNEWIGFGGSFDYNYFTACGSRIQLELHGTHEEQMFGPFDYMTGDVNRITRYGGEKVLDGDPVHTQQLGVASNVLTIHFLVPDAQGILAPKSVAGLPGHTLSFASCSSSYSWLTGQTLTVTGYTQSTGVVTASGFTHADSALVSADCMVTVQAAAAFETFLGTNNATKWDGAKFVINQPLAYWLHSPNAQNSFCAVQIGPYASLLGGNPLPVDFVDHAYDDCSPSGVSVLRNTPNDIVQKFTNVGQGASYLRIQTGGGYTAVFYDSSSGTWVTGTMGSPHYTVGYIGSNGARVDSVIVEKGSTAGALQVKADGTVVTTVPFKPANINLDLYSATDTTDATENFINEGSGAMYHRIRSVHGNYAATIYQTPLGEVVLGAFGDAYIRLTYNTGSGPVSPFKAAFGSPEGSIAVNPDGTVVMGHYTGTSNSFACFDSTGKLYISSTACN